MSPRATTGSSLVELLVVITMIAVLTAVGVSTFRASPYAFEGATNELVGDVRMTRTFAQSRGAHYRLVIVDESNYAIERLRREEGGGWVPAGSDRRRKVVDFAARLTSTPGTAIEFDTRGNAVGFQGIRRLGVEERKTGAVRTTAVWPSGQVIKE